jgi:hypothetical protein
MDSEAAREFWINENGRQTSQLCFSIAVYFPKTEATLDAAPAFDLFWKDYAADVSWFSVDGNAADQRISHPDVTEKLVRKSLSLIGKRGASVLVRSGEARTWGPPFLEFWSGPAPNAFGVLRILLPVEGLAHERLASFLGALAARLPYACAVGGFSVLWNQLNIQDRARMGGRLKAWALEYPGLMNSSAASGAVPAAQGLIDIGWITLLGSEPAAQARAGGIRDRLEALRPSGVTVDDLPDGSMQILAAPTPGLLASTPDVDNRYRIGAVLRPLWNEAANGRQVVPGFSDPSYAEQARWANRFFLPVDGSSTR